MKIFKTLLITWAFTAQAGLPPTSLSGQSSSTKPTTFTFKTPYSQSTQVAGIESLIETGSENMLINPGFEGVGSTGWTCTVGTCTKTTTVGQFSSGKAALSVALTAQAMNVSQTVTTASGIQKQGFARVIYRVPATMADFQVCTLVDAAEQTCVPTANLIKDDTFRSIEIPLTFGSTSAGIKFKTTSAYTATAYFDGAVLAQGLGLQNLMLDNVYSAKVSSTGVVSNENKDWINGNCVFGTPVASQYNCPVPVGIFTLTPNCSGSANSSRFAVFDQVNSTPTNIVMGVMNVASAFVSDTAFAFSCQKSGNDYLAASSNVYSQASANYDWTNTTVNVLTNVGTSPSPSTVGQCKHSRDGGDLLMSCSFTAGTSIPAALGSVDLPNSLTIDTSRIIAQNTTAAAGQKVGTLVQSVAGNIGHIVTALGTSTSKVYFSTAVTASNTLVPTNSNGFISASALISIDFRVPISGWSSSNSITGSFAGYNSTPGSVNPKLRSSVLTCTASSAIVSQGIGTSWVTSVGNISSGSCAITLPSGVFNSTPICMVSRSGVGVSNTSWAANASSATSVSVHCNAGGVNCTGGENINFYCHGE